jgi:hypothetical protein
MPHNDHEASTKMKIVVGVSTLLICIFGWVLMGILIYSI